MRVEFTDQEAALLREVLERTGADLREEVYKTEATDWKRELKAKQHLLEGLIAKLRTTA